MLKRLARVLWWFGALVWGLTALGCCYKQVTHLIEQHRCLPIVSEYADWQREYNEAKAKYEISHKKLKQAQPPDFYGEALEERSAMGGELGLPANLAITYSRCEAIESQKTYWFALLGASLLALLAFSAAFVTGGRFWSPPIVN
jgi:hypothetical protein